MGAVVVAEEAVACALDVVAREVRGGLGVTAVDGIEDALVLVDDIAECEQPVRLHLTHAELDLSHEQAMKARKARGPLGYDEGAVEGDVGSG